MQILNNTRLLTESIALPSEIFESLQYVKIPAMSRLFGSFRAGPRPGHTRLRASSFLFRSGVQKPIHDLFCVAYLSARGTHDCYGARRITRIFTLL